MSKTTNVKPEYLNYHSYKNDRYDKDIVRSIPGHKELHKEIENVVKEYTKENTVGSIIELGIGTGLTSEIILRNIPNSKLTAIDFSEVMLGGAKERLSEYQAEFVLGDYSELDLNSKYDMAVSVVGVHHQNNEGKQKVFKKVFDALNKGGIFIFGDLMTHKDDHKAALQDAKHYHHLVEHTKDDDSLKDWAHHHKFLNDLAPVEDQMDWLKDAGFSDVQIRYEYLNTILLIAIK